MFIKEIFDQLIVGNASVITSENIQKINNVALELYNNQNMDSKDIEELKYLIMVCNILYNRTDMTVLPIEDGFYDLLLEKYKEFDPNFQVGSVVVQLRNFIETDLENPRRVAVSPIIFREPRVLNEVQQEMYDSIMRTGKPILDKYDFVTSPILFENENMISKRTHNTEHNHPSLVGSLDKAKFIFIKDAVDAGVINDPTVKIFERDFFYDHIEKGIYPANRILRVVVELKYDGVSVEADCTNHVESARTRGDTGIGVAADITPILRGYPFKHAKCLIGEKPIGVKFEAIMTNTNLARFNELRGRNYSNCRTAIVGLFGASDAHLFRDLITLVPLALDRNDIPMITNRMEEIEFLNKVFVSHGEPLRYCYMEGTVMELLYMIKVFWDEAMIARNVLDFMYDGIVVSYLDEDIREKLGRKNYINKYSMAIKFTPLEKQTIFRGYTYEVGQHGTITPMIHYDPVEFLGTIHTKSTGSSLQRFQELGLKIGDYINVTYRNDVMPYVSKLECEHNRKNPNPPEQFIQNCPICGTPLMESASKKSIICPSHECPGRSVQRMSNMFAKLNLKGFSDATFVAIGKTHLYELFPIPISYYQEKLGTVNGAKFKSFVNSLMIDPIKDYIIMGALGFTSMAHKKWQAILSSITIIELYNLYLTCKTEEEFVLLLSERLPNIGEITTYTIAKEFPFFEKDIKAIIDNDFHHRNLIHSFGTNTEYKAQIRFTGIRNKQLSELLCNAGFDADDSASAGKKTDILIVPYEGFQSSKVNKVSDKCKIVPIDEFLNHMELYIEDKIQLS